MGSPIVGITARCAFGAARVVAAAASLTLSAIAAVSLTSSAAAAVLTGGLAAAMKGGVLGRTGAAWSTGWMIRRVSSSPAAGGALPGEPDEDVDAGLSPPPPR